MLGKQWIYGLGGGKRLPRKDTEDRWFGTFHLQHKTLRGIAKYSPLAAAIFAPLSTLFTIPALVERWYTFDGVFVHDYAGSIILSVFTLVFNLVANALLILRFSLTKERYWRRATSWSTFCWFFTLILGFINIGVYGIHKRNLPGFEFTEGFWCAVVSLADVGIIVIALTFHYIFAYSFGTLDEDDESEVRQEGKKFMLSVTFFLVIVGFQSLAYSELEGWLYSDAIYFSVQCALTIGYGDLLPDNTWAKILVFPFSILTISQLANEIVIIFGFIGKRAQERRERWRKRYEGAMHAEANRRRPKAGLLEEMALIDHINKREELTSQLYDLVWSIFALIAFWVVGAAMFSSIEGWSYGNAIYAVVILSLTIGFGDFVPTAPVGRIVWIPYALMSVPIVTSFAGQTITGLLSTFSRRRSMKQAFAEAGRQTPDAFKSHSDYVIRAHESYRDMRKRLLGTEDYIILDQNKGLTTNVSDEDDMPRALRVSREGKEKSMKEKPGAGGDERSISRVSRDGDGEEESGYRVSPTATRDSEKTFAESREIPSPTGQAESSSSHPDETVSSDSKHRHKHGRNHKHGRKGLGKRLTGDHSPENTVHKQVDKLISTMRKQERSNPANKDDEPFTEEEQRVRSEYQAVQKILETRKREGLPKGRKGHERKYETSRPNDREEAGEVVEGQGPGEGEEDYARCESPEEEGGEREDEDEREGKQGPRRTSTELEKAELAKGNEEEEDEHDEEQEEEDVRELELHLLRRLIELTIRLEAESRQMLLDSMEKGVPRTLLLADRNVQIRDVRALRGDDANILAIWRGEAEHRGPARSGQKGKPRQDSVAGSGPGSGSGLPSMLPDDDEKFHPKAPPVFDEAEDMLGRVRRYRNTFAEILVLGSILQKLEGEELNRFERWREAEKADELDLAPPKQTPQVGDGDGESGSGSANGHGDGGDGGGADADADADESPVFPEGAEGINRIQKEAWGGIGGNVMKNTFKRVRTGLSLSSFPSRTKSQDETKAKTRGWRRSKTLEEGRSKGSEGDAGKMRTRTRTRPGRFVDEEQAQAEGDPVREGL